jgi:signal transduction histidine kinase
VGAEEPTAGDYRMRARLDGVERFYSYRKLQSYPLTIFVGQSAATVLAPYYRQRDILLVGGVGATMMLAALLALALSRARDRRRYLEEQERVALDLHDSSIQSIYAVGLHLENSRRLIDTDPQRAARLVGEAEANLNLVIQDLRALIAGEVAPLGEKAFLDGLGRSIPAPGDGNPAFVLELEAAALRSLGEVRAIHVQRIAGEAISNVVRHARAKSARLSLVLRNGNICIEVSDDGVGMPEALNGNRGLGLHHIQARARKLGGQMNVASTPGGTRVTVEFPSK